MKSKILYSILMLLALTVMLTACQKNGLFDSSQSSNPTKTKKTVQVSSQYFPNKIGDSWTYLVTDNVVTPPSYTPITDTLQISIADTTHYYGATAAIWKTVWPKKIQPTGFRIDTSYVWVSGDTIRVSGNPPITGLYLIPFPIQIGSTWQKGPNRSKVVSKDSLKVPAGTFDGVYQIHTRGISFNYNLTQDVWFKPGVGILQETRFQQAFIGSAYTLRLISNHVK